MSTGTIFLIIILIGFGYFATQWGSSRGPGSIQKDLLNRYSCSGWLSCSGAEQSRMLASHQEQTCYNPGHLLPDRQSLEVPHSARPR